MPETTSPGLVDNFIALVKSALEQLGLFIENGIAQVRELIVEKIFAKKVRVNELEMIDKATGEIYCTWIENGEWVKHLGECQNTLITADTPSSSQDTLINADNSEQLSSEQSSTDE